jgi:hypothetical protein
MLDRRSCASGYIALQQATTWRDGMLEASPPRPHSPKWLTRAFWSWLGVLRCKSAAVKGRATIDPNPIFRPNLTLSLQHLVVKQRVDTQDFVSKNRAHLKQIFF